MNKIYDYWFKHKNVSKDLKKIMKKMSPEEIEYSFVEKFPSFGTAGYREIMMPGNIYGNEKTYQMLALGYANYILKVNQMVKPLVIVGHDNRKNAIEFTNIIIAVLTSKGIAVKLFKDNRPMFTPIISFCIRTLRAQGGINITASHNPKEYNGFKIYNSSGSQLLDSETAIVISGMPNWKNNLDYQFIANTNLISEVPESIVKCYLNEIKNNLRIHVPEANDKIAIIYTPHHGVGCEIMTEFLTSLGHNIIPVKKQNFFSETFKNSPIPNPEDPASFKLSLNLAKRKKAHLMLAVDPDGDRFACAIRNNYIWYYLNGNQMGILFTNYLLKKYEGDKTPVIITTYVSTNLVDKIAKKYNAKVIRTNTGFKNLGNAMNNLNKDEHLLIAFEEAIGCCILSHHREKDGISSAALLTQMYKDYLKAGLTLVNVLEEVIYPEYGYIYNKTCSLIIPGTNWKEKAKNLRDEALTLDFDHFFDFKILNKTWNPLGECIEWELSNNSWIKFRVSGTEPKFKVYFNLYFESQNFGDHDVIINDILKLIKEKLGL